MKLRHKPFRMKNWTSMQYCAMCYYPMCSMIIIYATNACIAQLYNALRLGCNISWLDLCEAYTVLNNLPLLHNIKLINYVWDSIKSTPLCDMPFSQDSNTLKQNMHIICRVPFKVKAGLETNACMHNPSMPWLSELLASTDSVLGNIMSNVLLLYDTKTWSNIIGLSLNLHYFTVRHFSHENNS